MDSPRIPTSLRMCGPLALALLAALPLVPIATRFGLLRWQIGLPLTALAVLGSAILLCVLLFLFFRAPLRAFRPLTAAIAGVALAPVMAGALVVLPAGELPVIHDISTDLAGCQPARARRGDRRTAVGGLSGPEKHRQPASTGGGSGARAERCPATALGDTRGGRWRGHAGGQPDDLLVRFRR